MGDKGYKVTSDGKIYKRAKKRYANRDYYDGEFVDGFRHGSGMMIFHNGDTFKGDFENDYFHGEGVYTYAPHYDADLNFVIGKRYDGSFRFGAKHGRGLFLLGNGTVYIGLFEKGLYHGQGTLKKPDKETRTGIWVRGKEGGQMKILFANGDSYIGEMASGKYDGLGKIEYSRGLGSYEGGYARGLRHGRGTRVFANGNKYVGEFQFGDLSGEGIMFYANGDQYIGEWSKGQMNGKGALKYARGDKYEGTFMNGFFQGEGRYEYEDGGYYQGEYRNSVANKYTEVEFPAPDGKRHGFGIRVWTNGTRYEGQWAGDRMDGKGELKSITGARYEGGFWFGTRNGHGMEQYGNVLGIDFVCPFGHKHSGIGFCRYIGEWKNNSFHGKGVFNCLDGRTYNGEWQFGKKNGKGLQTYLREGEKGDPLRQFIGGLDSAYRVMEYNGNWINNVRDGQGCITYVNGDTVEGNFIHGQPHGIMTYKFAVKPDKKHHFRFAKYEHGYRKFWLNKKETAAHKAILFIEKELKFQAELDAVDKYSHH